MNHALNAEGQSYKGFLVTKYVPLKELQSAYIELVHEQSGARIIQIANDDPENLFCLSFQTLPDSSNGVAHILEHTVLCGSEKFPIKDPFFSMTRRSLNTYMNALTGQDFTCYPASSQVEKDLYNLLDVYLDAVFKPRLHRLSFLQEGHRLAFKEAGHPETPLQFQGVVYNEMKGAMSGTDSRLWHHLFQALTPDLPYAHNSGGEPQKIPSLTHEQLIDFHRTFYHPARCLFFFYGNIPLAKHLDFLLEKTLHNIEKVPLFPPLPPQPRFTAPKHVTASYPVTKKEDKQAVVALGFLTAAISQQTELLGLSVLDSLLTDTDVSPLKRALLKSGLCTNVESSLDLEMSEAPWVLICKGCDDASGPAIEQLTRQTLHTLAQEGFSLDSIEASLHQLEFSRMEIGGEGVPFGLTLFFRAALAKQHGADPENALLIHSLFSDLRQRLQDPDYLPSLLRRYFLDNPHSVCLTLKADPALDQAESAAETDALEKIRKKLTPADIDRILADEKALAAYQEETEHQSLDCLPKISLKEVPPHAKDYPLSAHGSVYRCDCFTNRILYADYVFDLPQVPFADLPLLSFLSRIVTEIGAGGRSYAETLELQQATVGELSGALTLHIQHDDPSRSIPALFFRGKALERNTGKLFDLFRDFATTADFSDAERIQELLSQQATHLQNRLPKQAMSYATQLASSGTSEPAALSQQWQGLPYYHAVLQWAEKPIESLQSKLTSLYKTLFHHPTALVISSASDTPSLPTSPHPQPWHTTLHPIPHQGRIIAVPVAFNALAYQTVSYKDPDSAALMAATDLLENTFLHTEVREKGGAYGSGASYSPATGQFVFYSYRDPHLFRTYTTFHKALERLAAGRFTERELEESKLGILQDLDAPLPPGQRASAAYGWLRAGRTYERRDAFRRAILSATKQQVTTAIEKHLLTQKDKGTFVSFAGEELLKKGADQLPFAFPISPATKP